LALYESIGQAPDAQGLSYWEGRTDLTGADLKRHFRGAAGLPAEEFDQPADPDFQDRSDYIANLYRTVLGRQGDAAGQAYWEGRTDLSGQDLLTEFRKGAGLDNELYADPAYNAFMRTYRQREGTINADRADQARHLANQNKITQHVFDRQQEQGLQNTNNSYESRGMYQSGGRIRDRGQLITDIATNRANSTLANTRQQNELNRGAAQEMASLSRQRDEQEVAARNRLTNKSIQEIANG